MAEPAVCANHQDTRDMIVRVGDRVDGHEERIDTLERNEAGMAADFKALCWKLNAMIYVLGMLALSIFSALLAYLLK